MSITLKLEINLLFSFENGAWVSKFGGFGGCSQSCVLPKRFHLKTWQCGVLKEVNNNNMPTSSYQERKSSDTWLLKNPVDFINDAAISPLTGRHEVIFSNQWRKDILFEKIVEPRMERLSTLWSLRHYLALKRKLKTLKLINDFQILCLVVSYTKIIGDGMQSLFYKIYQIWLHVLFCFVLF